MVEQIAVVEEGVGRIVAEAGVEFVVLAVEEEAELVVEQVD